MAKLTKPTSPAAWRTLLNQISRAYRASTPGSAEQAAADAMLNQFIADYPRLGQRFLGKTTRERKLALMAQLIDNAGLPFKTATDTKATEYITGLDISRISGRNPIGGFTPPTPP